MKTLFIDTHLNDLVIILFDNDNIIASEKVIEKRNNSQYLMSMIKKVCDKSEYDRIVVDIGPGSFTGVRLGVTIAKTLAYTLNKPIIPITFFEEMYISCTRDIVGFSDGNGYFINEVKNDKMFYLKNSEYQDYAQCNNVATDVAIDYKKIIEYVNKKESINPHKVNPIYVKLIGVEYDKKNN